MLILGLDPGLSATGYGLIEADRLGAAPIAMGHIPTRRRDATGARLLVIYEGVRKICHAHRPDAVAVEALFAARNVRTVLQMAQARGVALLAAAEMNIPVFEYSPAEIKKVVTGSGRAGKRQVQRMVCQLCSLRREPPSEHAADALAAALCHALHLRLAAEGRPPPQLRRRGRRSIRRLWTEYLKI